MHVVIVNLEAGKGKAAKYVDRIKRYFESNELDFDMIYTEYPGHATEIARKYSKYKGTIIYSLGGDGTLNEIVNGVIGTDTMVINLPAGSGNDFIKSVTEMKKPYEIFERSFRSGERIIDTINVNGRYCINIASVGLDATVAHNAKILKKLPVISGSLAYFLSIFITLIKHKAYRLKINIDSNEIETENVLVAIANGKYYGGGMKAVPDAVIDDGYMDICIIKNMSILKIISLLNKYRKGNHVGLQEVSMLKARHIRIESNERLKINIDGEIIEDNVVDIKIYPNSLKISSL